MKIASILYIPPPADGWHPASFLKNLAMFQRDYPLVVLSDYAWPERTIPLTVSPESLVFTGNVRFRENGKENNVAIHNLLFFTALRIAVKEGLDWFIYLETDCRVGCDHWDAKITEALFRHPLPVVAGGSCMVFDPCCGGRETFGRFTRFMRENTHPLPPEVYGLRGPGDKTGVHVFPNGAGGIFNVAALKAFFPECAEPKRDVRGLACRSGAWDMEIGRKIWEYYGPHCFDVVAHLPCVYSTFGNHLTSEAERLQMLRDGDAALVHHVKSEVVI